MKKLLAIAVTTSLLLLAGCYDKSPAYIGKCPDWSQNVENSNCSIQVVNGRSLTEYNIMVGDKVLLTVGVLFTFSEVNDVVIYDSENAMVNPKKDILTKDIMIGEYLLVNPTKGTTAKVSIRSLDGEGFIVQLVNTQVQEKQ